MRHVSVNINFSLEQLTQFRAKCAALRAAIQADGDKRGKGLDPVAAFRHSEEVERKQLDVNVSNLLRVYTELGRESVEAMDLLTLADLVSQHSARRGRPGAKDRPEGFETVKVPKRPKADFSMVGKPKSARRAERRGGKAVR